MSSTDLEMRALPQTTLWEVTALPSWWGGVWPPPPQELYPRLDSWACCLIHQTPRKINPSYGLASAW